jgi:hypothetical protein
LVVEGKLKAIFERTIADLLETNRGRISAALSIIDIDSLQSFRPKILRLGALFKYRSMDANTLVCVNKAAFGELKALLLDFFNAVEWGRLMQASANKLGKRSFEYENNVEWESKLDEDLLVRISGNDIMEANDLKKISMEDTVIEAGLF